MAFMNMIPKESFKIQGSALNNFAGPPVILFLIIAGIELSLEVLMSAGIIVAVVAAFLMLKDSSYRPSPWQASS